MDGAATGRADTARVVTARVVTARVVTARVVTARSRVPTLREERRLLRAGHRYVAGMDEVGRGALAGPVTVGVVVVDAAARSAPSGVRDSKLLTPAAREALVPKLRRWAVGHAVGHAEPEEIDSHGIIAALRLAGRRALAQLSVSPSCVLLDGSHDWLTAPIEPAGLFDLDVAGRRPAPLVALPVEPSVTTLVKADLRCAAVAAASVLAKVERDAIMVERSAAFPDYGWRENKGYSAPEHTAALRRLGPCTQHRRSWSLPVTAQLADAGLDPQPLGDGNGPVEADVAAVVPIDPVPIDQVPIDQGRSAAFDSGELVLDLTRVGTCAWQREDPGRRADDAVGLRHDGSVAR
jgi:ribonuclease HII